MKQQKDQKIKRKKKRADRWMKHVYRMTVVRLVHEIHISYESDVVYSLWQNALSTRALDRFGRIGLNEKWCGALSKSALSGITQSSDMNTLHSVHWIGTGHGGGYYINCMKFHSMNLRPTLPNHLRDLIDDVTWIFCCAFHSQ